MIRFRKTREETVHGDPIYKWIITYIPKPVPITPSLEDDMVAISAKYGSCWKEGAAAFERSRFLHRFALYRWYREALRWLLPPAKNPAVFGDLDRPHPGGWRHDRLIDQLIGR